jgi:transcriptional regulator with XRE-family HTH domain
MTTKKPIDSVLIDNLNMIIRSSGEKKTAVIARMAKKNVTTRTINFILNGERSPGIGIVEAIAKNLGLEAWQLLVPNLTEEMIKRDSFKSFMRNYQKASPESKEFIELTAMREAKK